MDIFSIFIISVSLAIDAFTASFSHGTKLKKITICTIFKFGCFFGFFQFIAIIIGYIFGFQFSTFFDIYSSFIGFLLLFLLGFTMIYKSFNKKDITDINKQTDENLNLKQLLILSLSTSIDALIVGVSLAQLNTHLIISSLIIGLTTFLFSSFGVILGHKFTSILKFNQERFCGIILILLSFKVLYL